MAIAEFVFFILIILSSDYIQGLYQSEKIGNDYQKFDKVVSVMKPIILIFSILIVVGLTYTIHNFYQMTISSITSRFNIYLLCIAVSLTCWGSVFLLKGMNIYPISAILNLIILGLILLAVISNTWKIKALQILIIPVLLGFQAEYIRDFQEQQDSNIANCQQQMNNLSESYLSEHSLRFKIALKTFKLKIVQMDKKNAQFILLHVIMGGINNGSCRSSIRMFEFELLQNSQQYLHKRFDNSNNAIFGNSIIFICFDFIWNSTFQEEQDSDKTLGRNIETLFLLLFIGTIVFGVLLLVNNYTPIPLKKEINFDQPAKAVKAKEFAKIQTRMCQSITQLVGNRVELSSECKSTTNCPLNKVETGKKETNILFGLWVKGVQQFKRKEATTYQTLAAAKFLWPNYDGNELDFFVIIGKLEYVQQYLDDVQVCYQVGLKDLSINLYQNVVDIPIEEKNSKVYGIIQYTAAKPTEPSKGSPTTTSDKGSTDPKSQATSAQPKCEIPNCQECKDQQCTTCKTGFDKDDERGCKFTGKLGLSESIQVQLFKEMKSKVSGFVVGEIKKEEDIIYTQYPIQEAKICWSQEGLDKPICDVATPKGEYKLQISTFDVADYSTQIFQPTTGLITVAAIGYDDYVQSQVVQFQEEINFGTILLRSNVTIPKVQTTAPPPKSYLHQAETATTTTKPTTTTTTTEPAKPTSTTTTTTSGTTSKEPAKEQPKEPAKEQPKEPAKEQPKEPAKEQPKEAAKTEGGCKSGEYLDARKKCQPTGCTNVPFCKFCDKNNKCISCQAEYQLQADKSCLPENGCSKPYSQSQCLKCSKEKEKCDQNYCDAFSTFDNGLCKQAYKICTTKIQNCAICTKENKCAVCEQGYKVVNGECKLGDFSQIFQINYYQTDVYVVNVMDWNNLEAAKVDLRVGSCGSFQVYGTAKTDSNGKVTFTRLVKGSQYNLIVTHPDYSQNCYEFSDKEVTIVPMSKKLKSGQVRIVLEWYNPDINLDLQLSFNPTDTSNCLVGYLDNECTGAKFGKSSDEEYSFEAIEINALVLSKYLIFVQNFGDKENYQEKLISSNAHIKYYVADKDDPAVTFVVPNDKQSEIVGTTEALKTEWLAWLVGCIDANESEIPESLFSQNGVWWTASLNKWYPEIPQKTSQNYFPSPKICDV
ncbi:unnamed protein product (macronuclear) [Paramecium tetraurelia]|uniref:TNFR-Cys domain-containing protein n=1 Tax=Paramecium tetraurelia TaxID=5888 RepID=A0E4C6_PARTE|nr:uncharacterized protein GSPATT00023317001 [Paramecium tetraurelia]CAK90143.1 unnamed protein product [Paramecium tetraurelia]|eukprot:XP_001457540.1 hypothetical protein (macronuclear) [Paramecium tetraurelia strain d4-2]